MVYSDVLDLHSFLDVSGSFDIEIQHQASFTFALRFLHTFKNKIVLCFDLFSLTD